MPHTMKLPWSKFKPWFGTIWEQGQHVSIIGPTGRGKTTLAYGLLPLKKWVVIFGTKSEDDSLTDFAKQNGFVIREKWSPSYEHSRYLLWPKHRKPGDEKKQIAVFASAFDEIYVQGGWTLYIDETWYMGDTLGLDDKMNTFWTQSRSKRISFVTATQRARNVPLLMYDQATHLFVFSVRDEYARKRLGEIGAVDKKEMMYEITHLGNHEFLYINLVDDTLPRIISEVK